MAIAENDRIGVVGPNGSGKSTLLRILAGLETPDHRTPALRRLARVGYVPQDPTFPAAATIEDVVASAATATVKDASEAALQMARTFSRAGFVDVNAQVGTRSGGWQKRLAIVRELACEPDVLLLDERRTTSTSPASFGWRRRSAPSGWRIWSSVTTP